MKAGRRISLALALSVILFLPVVYASNTITLTSPNAQNGGEFGWSVAVSEGDPIVVVGAPGEEGGGEAGGGHAYVLDTATGLITTLTSPTPQLGELFGSSVAVSGTTVVVGAPGVTATHAGMAYVFDTSTALVTPLTSPHAITGGQFGQSVSVSGTTVVVGAPGETADGKLKAGNAYVFDSTTGFLTPTTLTRPTPQGNGQFGYSVAVSGTTVVVGAPHESGAISAKVDVGNAYVFDATDGSLITTLTTPNQQAEGEFGWSVAVSGTTVVVGAPGEPAGASAQFAAGNAYVFDSTVGFLTPTTLTSPYSELGGNFGFSVSVGGARVVVGAPFETVGSLLGNAGHAYSFDASAGFLTTTLTSQNAQFNGEFGHSVAVSQGDPTVVVGAPIESGGGTDAGHAYIFF